jgi:putative ABC transport system permease protein
MMTDLRFAFRQLLKTPGLSLLAVITLALGIGLNTAIFSMINDLFLRGLPFKQPERLLHLFGNRNEANLKEIAISAPRFIHYRDGQTIFSGLAAENGMGFTLTGVGNPVH